MTHPFSLLTGRRSWKRPARLLALLVLPLTAPAQPTVTGFSPARNQRSAPRAANVALTFDQAISAGTAGNIRVFSPQRGGQLVRAGQGTVSGGGTSTVTFDPTTDFRPGETVLVTVPPTVQSTGGQVANRHVYQFTAAVGGTGTGFFAAPATNPNPAVGTGPNSVVVGDVDGDGDLDLLTASLLANAVSVRLNDGAGSFSAPATNPDPAVGSQPYAVAVGDVDGDGDLDFLTANKGGFTVSVRLNDGTGNFTAPATNPDPAVSGHPYHVALGDVDGDGDLDFVAANAVSSTVSVRLNDGTGNFTAPALNADPAVSGSPYSVALGDVDGDGDLDMLTANFGGNSVSVRLNDGTGNFTAPATNPNPAVSGSPYSVAVGDVDGDGDLDFVTANQTDLTVSVRLNDGTGNFTAPAVNPSLFLGANPFCVVLGDVDGDGDLDFVTANASTNTVSVRLNNGTGNFTAPALNSNPAVGTGTQSVALGDMDGDGDLDLVASNYWDNSVSVRLNQVPPLTITALAPTRNRRNAPVGSDVAVTFSQPLQNNAATQQAVRVFSQQRGGRMSGTSGGAASVSGSTITFNPTTDFRPGETVLVTTTTAATATSGATPARGQVHQFTAAAGGTGVGNFLAPATNPNPGVGAGPNNVAVGDVDGDGDLDLIAATILGTTVSVQLNDGTGNFTAPATNPNPDVGNTPWSVALGDVDGDGDLDFVVTNFTANTAGVRLNDGTGNFTAPATNPNPAVGFGPTSVALGDVDGDGDLDLLVANFNSGTVSVRLNDGTGNFTAPATNPNPAVGNAPLSLALGDVDGDGDLDFVVTNASNGNTVSVRLNDGTGNFTPPATNSNPIVGTDPESVALGDVDGDGDLDFVVASLFANTVSVRLNDGTGNFTASATSPAVGASPSSVALGDVDGDGDLDLLVTNSGGVNTVSVRLNDGTGNFTAPAINPNPAVGIQPVSVTLGDVDGDGDLDFVTANASANNVSVRLNQAPAPTLASLSPTSASLGASITLTGTNFTGATGVSFNGTAATTFSVTNATTATATVPAGATTGNVTITTPSGTSNGVAFTVAPLTITALAPTRNRPSAPAGSDVAVTFSAPMQNTAATQGAVRVFSQQRGGLMSGAQGGAASVSGSTITFDPTTDFRPGERLFVTTTSAATSTGGATPARGQVHEFTAATGGTGTGLFGGGSTPALATNINGVALGDVNGDGIPDLLTANYNGGSGTTVSVALGTGAGGAFAAPSAVTVGTGPIIVRLADIDGDGDLDFVTANYGPSANGTTASVCRNNGSGGFTLISTITTGTSPRDVAFGDFDGDGDLDVLFPTQSSIAVFLNNGSGAFSAHPTTPNVTGIAFVVQLTVGDVDNDGDLDLLTANYSQSNTVSVRLNNGTGSFSGSQNVAVGTKPFSVAVGDVDADGDLDILTTNETANAVSIRFNNGSGTFAPPALAANGEVSVTAGPLGLAVGDVDGDGDLDFVSSGTAGGSVRLNNGSGVFSGSGTSTGGTFVTLADVDNDGDLDAAIAGGGATVAVRLNQAPAPTLSNLAPNSALVGTSITLTGTNLTGATGVSFNGTAAVTFSVINATTATATVPAGAGSGNVTITTPSGTSNGVAFTVEPLTITTLSPTRNLRDAAAGSNVAVTFSAPMQNTAATQGAVRVFSQQRGGQMGGAQGGAASVSGSTITFNPTTDFRPGETVLVTTTTAATGTGGALLARGQVHQFTAAAGGTGVGNFVAPAINPDPATGSSPSSVAVGDVDGDGDLDLLTTNSSASGTVNVRLNDGSGNFTAPATNPNPGVGNTPSSVALGDVDSDGDLDFVAANFFSNTVSVRLNDGTGNFTAPATNPNPSVGSAPGTVTLGDVDGDGDLDLLTANRNGASVSVRLNDGSGNFTAPATNPNPSVGSTPYSIALGDVDGDGDLDLLAANSGVNTVSVRLNDGTGNFTAPATNPNPAVGNGPTSVALGDVDGDGDLDLLAANARDNTVSVRLNDGTGNFTAPATTPTAVGIQPISLALGDVDGDGDLDFVVANQLGNSVSVGLNDGSGNFTAPTTNPNPAVGNTPWNLALGDVDGDGDLDLLTANNGSGTVSVRLNQPLMPTLTSFSPSSGLPGSVVTLTGTNFTGATGVSFGGIPTNGLTVVNATTLTAYVPVGAVTGPITLTTGSGTGASAAAFTVLAIAPDVAVAVTPAGPLSTCGGATLTAAATIKPFQPTGTGLNGVVLATTVQPDGKLLLGGSFSAYDGTAATRLIRLNADGTRDATFALTGTGLNNFVQAVAVQPDGKLLVGGRFNSYNGTTANRLIRLNADGTRDATFAPTGTGLNNFVQALALQPDGKLLVGGQFTAYNGTAANRVIRLNADGTRDATFAPTGTGLDNVVRAVAVQPDGKVLLSGLFTQYNGTAANYVIRLNADGTRDATFVPTGTGLDNLASALAVQPDGKVLLGGQFTTYDGATASKIIRLNTDGTRDATFTTGTGFDNDVLTVTVQPDGKLLVGGSFTTYNGTAANYVIRLNADGTRDATFAPTGTGLSFAVQAGAVQPNGKLLLGGNFTSYDGAAANFVIRLNTDGTPDNTATAAPGATYVWNPGGSTGATVVPGAAGGSYQATATVGGYAFGSNVVTVTLCVPILTAVSPAAELPGLPVVLTGTGFTAGSTVSFGGVAATSVTFTSATSLTAVVPVGAAAGSSAVVVTTANGSSGSSPAFEVLEVYNGGALDACATALPATATTGDGQWHYLLSAAGQVVLAYNYTGATLGTFSAEVLRAAPTNPVRQDGVGRNYLDRNWHLTAGGGAFPGRTVQLRFYGLTSELTRLQAADPAVTLANLYTTQYSGPNEDCTLGNNTFAPANLRALPAPATAPGNGVPWFVSTVSVADHFSEFYLTGSTTPLPVELVSFTAERRAGGAVATEWRTASEKENRGFIVQRSGNGREFAAVSGLVVGAGTSSAGHAYTFTDETAPTTLLYYRLLQLDIDGTATYSDIRAVAPAGSAAVVPLEVWPNPLSSGPAGEVRVRGAAPHTAVWLLDAAGRVVASASATADGTATLLAGGLPAGVYIVRTTTTAVRMVVME